MSTLQRFSLGLTPQQIADADALAAKLSKERGGKWSRADVIREALRRMDDQPTEARCPKCGTWCLDCDEEPATGFDRYGRPLSRATEDHE